MKIKVSVGLVYFVIVMNAHGDQKETEALYTNLNIASQTLGCDSTLLIEALNPLLSSLRTRDRYIFTEVVNFLYAKKPRRVHLLGVKGTIFLLLQGKQILQRYKKQFTNERVYNRLIGDVERKIAYLEVYPDCIHVE